MRGAAELAAARLRGVPVSRVDILINDELRKSAIGVENVLGDVVAVLHVEPIDTAQRCDLRSVRGVPVLILAASMERATPFAESCADHGASRVYVACPHDVMTYTETEGLQAWDL